MTLIVRLRAIEKRVAGLSAMPALFATIVAGLSAGLILGRLYFLQELVFFAGVIAILVFFGANLTVLVVLIGKALRGSVTRLATHRTEGKGRSRVAPDFEHGAASISIGSVDHDNPGLHQVLLKPEPGTGGNAEIALTVIAASEVVAKRLQDIVRVHESQGNIS